MRIDRITRPGDHAANPARNRRSYGFGSRDDCGTRLAELILNIKRGGIYLFEERLVRILDRRRYFASRVGSVSGVQIQARDLTIRGAELTVTRISCLTSLTVEGLRGVLANRV